jgi:hypothetical protein
MFPWGLGVVDDLARSTGGRRCQRVEGAGVARRRGVAGVGPRRGVLPARRPGPAFGRAPDRLAQRLPQLLPERLDVLLAPDRCSAARRRLRWPRERRRFEQ